MNAELKCFFTGKTVIDYGQYTAPSFAMLAAENGARSVVSYNVDASTQTHERIETRNYMLPLDQCLMPYSIHVVKLDTGPSLIDSLNNARRLITREKPDIILCGDDALSLKLPNWMDNLDYSWSPAETISSTIILGLDKWTTRN